MNTQSAESRSVRGSPLLHAFFGVSRVRFWTHFWASLAGYVLPLLLVSFFGQRLFDAMKDMPASAWVGLAGGTVLVGLGAWAVRRRTARGATQVVRG